MKINFRPEACLFRSVKGVPNLSNIRNWDSSQPWPRQFAVLEVLDNSLDLTMCGWDQDNDYEPF